jgi:ribosomal protein L11 methyltransferase
MPEFIEVVIRGQCDLSELSIVLARPGIAGAWEEEGVLRLYWESGSWSPEILGELQSELQAAGTGEITMEVSAVDDRDWNASWVARLEPIRIGRNIMVRQSWNSSDRRFTGIELVIDPKRAFGSGHHATTQLLVEALEDEVRGGEHILDVGTGSGILAMAAARLGAAFVLGIDNDPVAIECACENARANGFSSELELRLATAAQLGLGEFDIVLANLDRRTLIDSVTDLRPRIRAGGAALLSGLLLEDCSDVVDLYGAYGGRLQHRRERDEWAALHLRF